MSEAGDPCDVLVTAAFGPELVGLAALLGPAMKATVSGLKVVARPVGVGLVASATGTASVLARMQPRAVILVGTCGAYPGAGLVIGDLVLARSVQLVEPAVIDEEAAFPEPMCTALDSHAPLTAAIGAQGGRLVDVATTLAVTTSDALAPRLGQLAGGAVEHLEAFAVASACAVHRAPFAAVLAVANAVGSAGREQWRDHHQAAGRTAAGFIGSWLRAGAAGVPTRGW